MLSSRGEVEGQDAEDKTDREDCSGSSERNCRAVSAFFPLTRGTFGQLESGSSCRPA